MILLLCKVIVNYTNTTAKAILKGNEHSELPIFF